MNSVAPTRMRQVSTTPDPSIPSVRRLHHYAYRCKDAEETRHFYEDVLGLPLARTVSHDRVPSTGEPTPYCHLFFELCDGSYIAFFDIFDGKSNMLAVDVPQWIHHIALLVDSESALFEMKARLERHGVEVLGPVTHSIMSSIYFVDPNGHRMEFVWEHDCIDILRRDSQEAHRKLRETLSAYVPERLASDQR